MKTRWIGVALSLAAPMAFAQATIYKHVDDNGRVTYTNRPMKGAIVMDLEPLSTIPGIAGPAIAPEKAAAKPERLGVKPSVAVVSPQTFPTTLAFIDRKTQKGRDDVRRRILENELAQEEKSLTALRKALLEERQNPTLIAAVRVAQQAADPTPAEQVEMRANIDRASGRIRGLQATVTDRKSVV